MANKGDGGRPQGYSQRLNWIRQLLVFWSKVLFFPRSSAHEKSPPDLGLAGKRLKMVLRILQETYFAHVGTTSYYYIVFSLCEFVVVFFAKRGLPTLLSPSPSLGREKDDNT